MRVRHGKRLPNWVVGVALVVLVAVGSVLAYTKKLPFGDPHEIQAVFSTAQNVRPSSPVRIAGVNVGEVTKVEHQTSAEPILAQQGEPSIVPGDERPGQQAAVVTMELEESALPIHTDAMLKLRPRLFLEGNLFVELQPGSPNAPVAEDGFVFPVSQTAVSVQLDQVLTTLQSDVRRNLQTLLDQLGNAFIKYGGAKGFRELYRTSPPSYKFTSQVNEAYLGTEQGDLRGVIRGLDRVVRALGRNELALQNLVTNFRIFSGSFAAEDEALGRAIEELPRVLEAARPAFANLNEAFPPLRAFAREILPGVRSTPETLDVAIPFIRQVRLLMRPRELRGLVADLRPTIPKLARLAKTSIPFLQQSRLISSCFNEVVVPWSHDTVKPRDPAGVYPHDPVGRVFEETAYGFAGIAGESRSGDANGQYIRILGAGGLNTIKIPNAGTQMGQDPGVGYDLVGTLPFELIATMPKVNDSAKTPFTDRRRCETQEPPNLEGGIGSIPFEQGEVQSASSLSQLADEPGDRKALSELSDFARRANEVSDGDDASLSSDEKALGHELQRWLRGSKKGSGN